MIHQEQATIIRDGKQIEVTRIILSGRHTILSLSFKAEGYRTEWAGEGKISLVRAPGEEKTPEFITEQC